MNILNSNPSIIARFRRLFSYFGIQLSPSFEPVVVVNDDKQTQVTCFNAERTSSGTTALKTTLSDEGIDTYITAITLTISEATSLG